MFKLTDVYEPSIFGDEVVLRSIDWMENFPWRQENTVRNEKDKYEIRLLVKDFEPNEISVKTSNGLVIVEATHDEKKDDYGFISRHFVRKYRLPEACLLDKVETRLTPDGILIITAPVKPVSRQDTIIPVSHEKAKSKSKL